MKSRRHKYQACLVFKNAPDVFQMSLCANLLSLLTIHPKNLPGICKDFVSNSSHHVMAVKQPFIQTS